MKKSLLSRIGKIALIPALTFSLNTGKVQAQNMFKEKIIGDYYECCDKHQQPFHNKKIWFGLNHDFFYCDAPVYEKTEDFIDNFDAYEGWEKNYKPGNVNEEDLEYRTYGLGGMRFKIEPTLNTKYLKFGFPIDFTGSNWQASKDVLVYWWDPHIPVSRLEYKKTPSIGISADLKILQLGENDFFENGALYLTGSKTFSKYKFRQINFEGVDSWGRPNSAREIERLPLDKYGKAERFSLGVKLKWPEDLERYFLTFNLGYFNEKLGEDIKSQGIYFGVEGSFGNF